MGQFYDIYVAVPVLFMIFDSIPLRFFFLVQIIIIINTIIGRMQNMYSLNVIGDSVREMQSCFYTF